MNNSKIPSENLVNQTYSGIDGKCCCGCAGKHYEDARGTKLVLGKMRKAEAAEPVDVNPTYVSVVVGSRLYIAYTENGR